MKKQMGYRIGVGDYMAKPINLDEVLLQSPNLSEEKPIEYVRT